MSLTKKEQAALKGLDGSSAITAADALIRLEEVQRVFSVFGVDIRSDKGRNRSCPIGAGHRPALTLIQQLRDENPRNMVYVNVTVAV